MIRPTAPTNPPQLSTPPRSTTFPAKQTHKHHIPPHRVHHHHHHHRDHSSVPQSATLPTTPSPFGDFLSKTTSRIDGSKTPPGGPLPQPGEKERVKESQESASENSKETWKEVARLRSRRNAADEDLRTRLATLSTLSTTTTRRLDYAYYSLLSSLSSLTAAVSAVSSLAAQTSSLHTHFTSTSSALASEATAQMASSNDAFEAQARRISVLELRMRKGREKVGRLGERLDGVREKVERSSLRDRQSRRTRGRRLKMLWCSLGFMVALFLILAATRQWRRDERATGDDVVHLGNRTEEVAGRRQEEWRRGRERRGDDGGWRPDAKASVRVEDTAARSSAVDADATLRLFDEL